MGCSLRAYGQEEAACTIFAHANKETEWVTNPPAVWSVSTHQMKLKGRVIELEWHNIKSHKTICITSAFIHPSGDGTSDHGERGMQHNPLPSGAAAFSLLMICRGGILRTRY